MKSTLFSFALLLVLHYANAQVKTNFNNPDVITSRGKFMKPFRAKSPYVIPVRNIKALLEKEALENASGDAKPFRIAEAIGVDIDVVKEAVWVEDGGYAYGKFSIVAAGAKSISVSFDRFNLPKGTELYVYSENGKMITGPVTENENNSNNFWGSWVYNGGLLTVDFRTPIESKASLNLHIANVAYGYKSLYVSEVNNFGESSECNINVICAPIGNGWENERNSVALILNGSGTALCSGALVNNTCNLNTPNFLTANHCFDGNSANWRFTFQAWSPICDRLQQQNANGTTFNGSTLRARNAGSDFCLVELNQMPPSNSGITFSGWSRNTAGIQNTTIIHHPAGDVMKISRDDEAPVFATFLGSQAWQLVLDQGATNGGSSGAPYYDQNHRIIAQHHGINQNNADQCLNVNKFGGRFNVSWAGGGTDETRLSNWLDPGNTGALTTNARSTSIDGASLVCSASTYSYIGPPVTWQSSNPNGLSIDPNTGFATRQNNFNGQVAITATAGGACGDVPITRNIWVGSPDQPLSLNQSISNLCIYSGLYVSVDPVPGAEGYSWVSNDPGLYVENYSSPTNLIAGEALGEFSFTITALNSCGSNSNIYYASVFDCSGDCGAYPLPPCGGDFSVFPNPTKDNITISLSNQYRRNAPSTDVDIILIDSQGFERKRVKSSLLNAAISLNGLDKGLYFLKVIFPSGSITGHIVKE